MCVTQMSLEDEYKKSTGITPEDIRKLRDWLNTQPHLPKDHITDLDLILTYHCCDQSAEVSKQLLDHHFTLRTLFTDLFKDRTVDDRTEHNLNTLLMHPLPQTRDGYAAFYIRLIDYEPKNLDFAGVLSLMIMIMDLWQFEKGTCPGFVLVYDLDGLKLGHLSKLDFQPLQQFQYYLQEVMLINLKGLHLLNAPSFMDRLMMIIKPFIRNKLMEVMRIHQVGAKTLDPYVAMETLPTGAFGGEYKTFDECRDETLTRMRANKEFFVSENKKRVVESLRPGKPKTISDIFGSVEGSFKKLDID